MSLNRRTITCNLCPGPDVLSLGFGPSHNKIPITYIYKIHHKFRTGAQVELEMDLLEMDLGDAWNIDISIRFPMIISQNTFVDYISALDKLMNFTFIVPIHSIRTPHQFLFYIRREVMSPSITNILEERGIVGIVGQLQERVA